MLKRGPVPWLVGGGLAILLLLLATYWFWIRPMPSYPRVQRPLPKPNARDDFIAAGKMSAATGGDKILGPDGKPVRRNGRELYASGPGVTVTELRAVVARNRPALARLRQGLQKQYGNPPVNSMSQRFPELAQFRSMARVLVAEGKVAEHEGRLGDAASSYADCLQLGTMVPRGGTLIHGLVGLAVHSIGLHALDGMVDRLDGRTAGKVAQEMERLERQAYPLADTLLDERETVTAGMLEFFRRPAETHQQMGAGDDEPAPDADTLRNVELFARLAPKKWIIDNTRGYLDALIAASRQPHYVRSKPPPLPLDPMSRILVPVYNDARPKWAQRDAHWRVIHTRLALRAYQQRHRSLPPSLSGLVPAYMAAVPQDPYAPNPLVYRRQGSRPLVYSRGPDGDDDGGRDLGLGFKPDSDGDVVTMKRKKS